MTVQNKDCKFQPSWKRGTYALLPFHQEWICDIRSSGSHTEPRGWGPCSKDDGLESWMEPGSLKASWNTLVALIKTSYPWEKENLVSSSHCWFRFLITCRHNPNGYWNPCWWQLRESQGPFRCLHISKPYLPLNTVPRGQRLVCPTSCLVPTQSVWRDTVNTQ